SAAGASPVGPWQPWPGLTPPELRLLLQWPSEHPVVALVGAGGSPRGQRGLVGIPNTTETLHPNARVPWWTALNRESPLVFWAGYELGYPHVHLPAPSPPPGQPFGAVLALDGWMEVDHHERLLRF